MFSVVLLSCVCAVAVQASVIDSRSFRLPNQHTLAIGAMNTSLLLVWTSLVGMRMQVVFQSVAVAIAHLLLALLPARVFGMGDAKLVAALAPVMLWWGIFGEWMLVSYIAAAVRSGSHLKSGRNQRIAFGPYLSGAWMLIVMGQLARVAMAYCR